MICPVDIKNLSTFKIGSLAHSLERIIDKNQIPHILKEIHKSGTPFQVLGSGSNTIFGTNTRNLKIIKIETRGIEIIEETDSNTSIKVSAGECWDEFVGYTVNKKLSGVEALSYIPGTVGASPVQNIGAYGSEARDTILQVEAFDTKLCEWKVFDNAECGFSYRTSIFKQNPGRYIITSVIFKLNKKNDTGIPQYKDVINFFESKNIMHPSVSEIREAIISIRKAKLPDPNLIPNCGSFFKNPIITYELSERIRRDYPNAPIFKNNSEIKIPASFLIDSVGLKGKSISKIVIHQQSAVVLTNPHGASFKDLMTARDFIINKVYERFKIILEPEVNIIN